MTNIHDFCEMLSHHNFDKSELESIVADNCVADEMCGFKKSISDCIKWENTEVIREALLKKFSSQEKVENFLNSLKNSDLKFSNEFLILLESFLKSETNKWCFIYLNYTQENERIIFLDNQDNSELVFENLGKILLSGDFSTFNSVSFDVVSQKIKNLLIHVMDLPLFLEDKEMLLNFILNGQDESFGFRLQDNKEIIFQYEDIFKWTFIKRLWELSPSAVYCVNHNFKLESGLMNTQSLLLDNNWEDKKYLI